MNRRVILLAALFLVVLALASMDQVATDEQCLPEGSDCDPTNPKQCCSGQCGDNDPKTKDANKCAPAE